MRAADVRTLPVMPALIVTELYARSVAAGALCPQVASAGFKRADRPLFAPTVGLSIAAVSRVRL